MSGRRTGALDPQLAASLPAPQFGQLPRLPPPPGFGGSQLPHHDCLTAEVPPPSGYGNGAQQSPQPYYHYPTPQTRTPSQQYGAASIGSRSNQTSPDDASQTHGLPLHESDGDNVDDGLNADDPKRPRACESCRGLKVRCDQDAAHPEIPCKRCAKAGRQCVITQPSRKRQKKADSRVAELEKKLDALTAVLHQQQTGVPGSTGQYEAPAQQRSAPPAQMTESRMSTGSMATYKSPGQYPPAVPPAYAGASRPGPVDSRVPLHKRRRSEDINSDPTGQQDNAGKPVTADYPPIGKQVKDEDSPLQENFQNESNCWCPNMDLKRFIHHTSPEQFVKRINSLIPPDIAAKIFERYTTKLAPHLPAVVFSPEMTAEQLFREKPILYLCILSAASYGTVSPEASRQIGREAVGAIADCVVRHGAKSLELIQAMHVTALWYKPPEQAEQTNFYQIMHMAAIMALDIGLGKRFNSSKARRGFGGPGSNMAPGLGPRSAPQDSDTLEARRAWLGCYYLCASASMVLRRPNLVRWTNYMKECIEVLETHPDAFASDKVLCQHVKIQHICEDIGLQFLMDDNTAQISITDPKVTYALNVLENELKLWKEQVPPEARTPGLQFFEHVTSLYLHEIALHFNHNIEDFRLPFTEESLKSVNNTSDKLTQNQMAALEACQHAAHGILDTMLAFDIQTIKSLPMLLFFVRCVYAVVILIKMHVAVCTPNSELGKLIQPEDLKVEHYLDALINVFGYVATEDEYKPHPKILRILHVLRNWFGKHEGSTAAQRRGEQPAQQQSQSAQQDQERGQYSQTPLHMLSQVATGRQGSTEAQDWTFNTPTVMNYSQAPPPGHPDHRLSVHRVIQQQPSSSGATSGAMNDPYVLAGDGSGMMDPTNPTQEYGWGSGFEQAMDIAMGGISGLEGGGLDDWFLGENMAPFGFSGEMGQW